MDAGEPRVRRRGFFLHSTDGNEPDTGEHENVEGVQVRLHTARSHSTPRQFSSSRRSQSAPAMAGRPEIRSGSVTGSRQRAHLPR